MWRSKFGPLTKTQSSIHILNAYDDLLHLYRFVCDLYVYVVVVVVCLHVGCTCGAFTSTMSVAICRSCQQKTHEHLVAEHSDLFESCFHDVSVMLCLDSLLFHNRHKY